MTSEDYLRRVGSALRDLPWRQRHELLTELRGHLADFPADTDLGERLGTPEQYAAELRTAEGLERHRNPVSFLRARRPRNVILTAVAVVIVALAIGAGVWIQSYQPLGLTNLPPIFPAFTKYAPEGNTYSGSVAFRKGHRFQLGFVVRNTGPFTIHVLGVPYPARTPWSARLVMGAFAPVARTRPGEHELRAKLTPFRPFDLAPGEQELLELKGTWTHCPSATYVVSTFPVRYSFLWTTATAQLGIPGGLSVVPPSSLLGAMNCQ
jgi:hypothetical protein